LALLQRHSGDITSAQATIEEAISLETDLNDLHGLAVALNFAAAFACDEHNLVKAERYSSDLIELSTRHGFALWMAVGIIYRGWVRSAAGNRFEGIPYIEQGIRDVRATGTLGVSYHLALKAQALYLADRSSEALAAIKDAEALADRFEHRVYHPQLRRLRGVFLTAMGADEAQIEASFCEAISIAKEQKSVSLEKRAEATYAEYRRQKASGSGGRGFRLPLW